MCTFFDFLCSTVLFHERIVAYLCPIKRQVSYAKFLLFERVNCQKRRLTCQVTTEVRGVTSRDILKNRKAGCPRERGLRLQNLNPLLGAPPFLGLPTQMETEAEPPEVPPFRQSFVEVSFLRGRAALKSAIYLAHGKNTTPLAIAMI